MIVCFGRRENVRVEELYHRYQRRIYGLPFLYEPDYAYAGYLCQGEDLFISACGDAAMIGEGEGGDMLSPAELADWLKQRVFPVGYCGNIYVSALGSAPRYLHALQQALGDDFYNRVFGMFDIEGGHVEPPRYSGWLLAGEAQGVKEGRELPCSLAC